MSQDTSAQATIATEIAVDYVSPMTAQEANRDLQVASNILRRALRERILFSNPGFQDHERMVTMEKYLDLLDNHIAVLASMDDPFAGVQVVRMDAAVNGKAVQK